MQEIPSNQINQQQEIFHIAFAERKKINIQKFKQYMSLRGGSLSQRFRIYMSLQNLFKQKIEYTKYFIKDFIKYFEDTLTLYAAFFKSISKLDLNKKPKQHFIYEPFQKAVLQLTQLNQGEVQNLKVLTTWIQKILIPAFVAILQMYRDWTKDAKKQMQNLQSQYDSTRSKQVKFYQKIGDNNDLLQNQIILLDKLQLTDQTIIKWGKNIFSSWQNLLKKQSQIRQQLQKNIIQFHDKFVRVYNQSEISKSLLKFWMQIQGAASWFKTFNSVLNEKDIDFISFGNNSKNIKNNFESFIQMKFQKQRTGDPLKLIDILQNKKFKCKLQKTQRQYIPIRVYFTIDKNILLFDQQKKKVFMKLKQQGFKIKRVSQNLVQLCGIQVGVIFDSTRRQKVHFNTMDEAEQFSFFVQHLLQQNAVKQ